MTPLEQLLSPDQPYAVRYAASVTRGLPVPEAIPFASQNYMTQRGVTKRPYTLAEDNLLRKSYAEHRDAGTLDVLCLRLDRSKNSIYERARLLRITNERGRK